VNDALGILEISGCTPAMVALDAIEKASGVRLLQWELNDAVGVVLKVTGSVAAVQTAIEAGRAVADAMGGKPAATVINRPDERAWAAINSGPETSALTNHPVVKTPNYESLIRTDPKGNSVAETPSFALGFIETQGFVAVFEAIDSACKAANVEVLGKEKLGGGYITVIVRGDVAAVKAAIEAGTAKVQGLGKLIAGHVIARPSQAVLALLPK
jgi:microcompartment protein CcmL/EutN